MAFRLYMFTPDEDHTKYPTKYIGRESKTVKYESKKDDRISFPIRIVLRIVALFVARRWRSFGREIKKYTSRMSGKFERLRGEYSKAGSTEYFYTHF